MLDRTLIIGTRGSALALWQARHVQERLAANGVRAELKEISTTGDRILDVPLAEIGDKGLFTKELDRALLDGTIDLAVHSLKDLTTTMPDGIRMAAVSAREEPWDAFVAHPSFGGQMVDLPEGATVATSSLRRQAQLRAWRPDLRVASVRGNVGTRLTKLDEGDWHGMILATAGLLRLGLAARIRERIAPEIMLPAVGQAALGVTCADGDEDTAAVLHQVIDHRATRQATAAERAFLRKLEGGCSVPVGAWGRVEQEGQLVLDGCVASLDGTMLLRDRVAGPRDEGAALGLQLAEMLLERGAGTILDAIRTAI